MTCQHRVKEVYKTDTGFAVLCASCDCPFGVFDTEEEADKVIESLRAEGKEMKKKKEIKYIIEETVIPRFSNKTQFYVIHAKVRDVFGGFQTRKEAEKYIKEIS